jgi:trigger factor
LKVTKDKVENRQAYLTIEMEPADMEEGYKDAYHHLVQTANIPGFRKGKAPRAVVERTLGKGRMLEEAIDHMIPGAYEKACKEQDILPYAQPEVKITKADPLVFEAVIPLYPTVTLGDYKSIRSMPEVSEIKPENIDSVMEELRHQHATWEPVDRPVVYNDLAVIDINADEAAGDKPLVKKAASQYQVLKDSISPAPGFVAELIGMKKEEKKEFDLTFPEDYPSKQLAGKKAHFKVTLHEIKEEKLPELNDDFAKQLSTEFKNLGDLRAEAEKSLKMRAEERARMDHEEKVITTAVEQSKIEYPPVVIDIEVERIIKEQDRQMQMSGQTIDDYLKSINKTAQQLVDDLKPIAIKNIAASLVLSQIAETEKIEVTEEEIKNGISNMVRSIGQERQDEMLKLLDTPQTRQSLTQSIKTRKTIEFLTNIAKDVKPSAAAEPDKEKKEEEK